MSIIAVDIDGVVADLHTEWLRRYNADYNDDLTYKEITKWGIHEFVKPKCGRKIYEYLLADDLYDDIRPIPGAVLGVNTLRVMGHRIVFVSAGFYPSKVKWLVEQGLSREFPYNDGRWDTVTDVILTGDKTMVRADIIIDDRPENLKGFHRRILFNQPWNQERLPAEQKIHRANTWDEIVDIIRGHYTVQSYGLGTLEAGA